MEKPSKLAFSEEATFSFTQGVVLIPIIIITSGTILGLFATDMTLSDLGLPLLSGVGMVSIIVGIFGSVALGHRISERLAIRRMFTGDIWECWQYSSSSWLAKVEADCNLISPKEEGLEAYQGVIYSSIIGLIFAAIIIAISLFAIKDPMIKKSLLFTSGVVFLLFVGAGLFQPLAERYKADKYRRKAVRFQNRESGLDQKTSTMRLWVTPL